MPILTSGQTELCKLGEKYGTDKAGIYTAFYDSLLRGRRNTVTSVLEIGIGHPGCMGHVPGYKAGASLRMWAEYFPKAHILGMDLVNYAVALPRDDRIFVILRDQGESADLEEVGKLSAYDLIVDDGSHDPEHQILGAITLYPHLRYGGLYIIEDASDAEVISKRLPFAHSIVTTVGSPVGNGHCIVIEKV